MQLKTHVNTDFPVTHPYRGVNSITEELITCGYIVVIDEEKKFWGILTPADLIKRPHKLVADCLTPKDILTENDTIAHALEKFRTNQSTALPYFHRQDLIGMIEKETLTKHVLKSIDDLFEKSESADKFKKLMLANISHEVRTPLNSIIGFLELINEITPEEAHYSEFSGIIRKSAEHFLIFMSDLIDLSLIQAGHSFNLSIDFCALDDIFLEVKDLFFSHFLYTNKEEVDLYFGDLNRGIIISTDIKRLKHILYHLIDSAIRSLDRGKIELGYDIPTNGRVRIFLNMHIEGMADEKMTFLAIPGNNGHPEEGISFVWIRELAKLLNGNVSYEEVSSNQHCFHFSLPVEPPVFAN